MSFQITHKCSGNPHSLGGRVAVGAGNSVSAGPAPLCRAMNSTATTMARPVMATIQTQGVGDRAGLRAGASDWGGGPGLSDEVGRATVATRVPAGDSFPGGNSFSGASIPAATTASLSALASAPAVAKRSSGSRAKALRITRSTASGMSGLRVRGSSNGSVARLKMMATGVSASCGMCPVIISNRMMPKA